MDILVKIPAFLLLSVCTVSDIRRREVSLWVCIAAGVLGLWVRLAFGDTLFPGLIFSLLPGAVFVIISALSHEKVGMGDAAVLLALGAMLSPYELMSLLVAGLLAISFFSLVLLTLKKVSLGSRLPMVPFMLAAFAFCTVTG